MTLADYLESKAEYIFDNYRPSYYFDVEPQDLQDNREVIVERLKRGFMELAKLHDKIFFRDHVKDYLEDKRYRKNLFVGWVRVYWGEPPKRKGYFVGLRFVNWSFTNIILKETPKKFEDLFEVVLELSTDEAEREGLDDFYVGGNFLNPRYYIYKPSNFLFLNPVIAKLNKSNGFKIFKDTDVEKLNFVFSSILKYFGRSEIVFGDFIMLALNEKYLGDREDPMRNLLIKERADGRGVDIIKLSDKEHNDIKNVIEYIKEEKQIPNTEVFLQNVLSKYIYLKIKGNVL